MKEAKNILRSAVDDSREVCIAIQKDRAGKLAALSWKLTRDVMWPLGGRLPIEIPRDRRALLEVPGLSNVTILRVSNGDIPRLVADGAAAFGIVGEDQMLEQKIQTVAITSRLGEARSSLQVMTRTDGTIRNKDDLQGKKIVTPFRNLTEDFLERENIIPRAVQKVKSTEGAVASGAYDAGFDLVETGDSMRANKLTSILKIQDFEAVLIQKTWNP